MFIKIKDKIINPACIAYAEAYCGTCIHIVFHGIVGERNSTLTIDLKTIKAVDEALNQIYEAVNKKGE